MKVAKETHIGLVRKSNEDALVLDEELGLFGVADGMGGHQAGEVASNLAAHTLISFLREHNSGADADIEQQLTQAVQRANELIYAQAQENSDLRGMGTTVSAGIIRDSRVTIANVGDSRAYLLRGDSFTRLTSDHSLVFELVQNGGISQEEAFNHPRRNVLTRALGTSPEVIVDITDTELAPGDILMFCTDGLTGVIRDEELHLMLRGREVSQTIQELLAAALDRGGVDNITMVLVEV